MDGSWACNGRKEDGTCCSQILTANTKFCPECGTPNTKKPAAKPSCLCRACGNELEAGYNFCPSCGGPVGQPMCHPQIPIMHDPEKEVSDAVVTSLKDPLVSLSEAENDAVRQQQSGMPSSQVKQQGSIHGDLIDLQLQWQQQSATSSYHQQLQGHTNGRFPYQYPYATSPPPQQAWSTYSNQPQQWPANASQPYQQWLANNSQQSQQQWPANTIWHHQQRPANASLPFEQWPTHMRQLHQQRQMNANQSYQQWPTNVGQPWPYDNEQQNATSLYAHQQMSTHASLPCQQEYGTSLPNQHPNSTNPSNQSEDVTSPPRREHGGSSPLSLQPDVTSPHIQQLDSKSHSSHQPDGTSPSSQQTDGTSPVSQQPHCQSLPSQEQGGTSIQSQYLDSVNLPNQQSYGPSPPSQKQYGTNISSQQQVSLSLPSQKQDCISPFSQRAEGDRPLSQQQHGASVSSQQKGSLSQSSQDQDGANLSSQPQDSSSPPSQGHGGTSLPSQCQWPADSNMMSQQWPTKANQSHEQLLPIHSTQPHQQQGPTNASHPGQQEWSMNTSQHHQQQWPVDGSLANQQLPMNAQLSCTQQLPTNAHLAINQQWPNNSSFFSQKPIASSPQMLSTNTSLPSQQQLPVEASHSYQHHQATSLHPKQPWLHHANLHSQQQYGMSLPIQNLDSIGLPIQHADATSPPTQRPVGTSLPSQHSEGTSLPSEKCSDTSLPSEIPDCTSPLSQHSGSMSLPQADAAHQPDQDLDGTSLPNQQPQGPSQPIQQLHGPSQPIQQMHGPSLPNQQVQGPSLPNQQVHGPSQPIQQMHGPSLPNQQVQGPSLPNQQLHGPSLPNQQQEGPTLRDQQTHGPSLSSQEPGGTRFPIQQADTIRYANKQPNGPIEQPHHLRLPNQQLDGPKISNQQPQSPGLPSQEKYGTGQPNQQLNGKSPCSHQLDGTSQISQQPHGPSPPKEQSDGPSLSSQKLESTRLPSQQADATSPPSQQRDVPSLLSQEQDGTDLAIQHEDSKSPSIQQADCPSQKPDRTIPVSQEMNFKSPSSQQPHGPNPPSQPLDGPSLSSQKPDSTNLPSHQADATSPPSQQLDGTIPVSQKIDGKSPSSQQTHGPSPSSEELDSTGLPSQLADATSQASDQPEVSDFSTECPNTSQEQGATNSPTKQPGPTDDTLPDQQPNATNQGVANQQPIPYVDILPSQHTHPTDDHSASQESDDGQWYNKRKTEPDVLYEGKKNTPKQSHKGKRKDDVTTLEFVVVLDPQFKSDRKPGRVYITFSYYQLGMWEILPQHELTLVPNAGESTLMRAVIEVPTCCLRMNPPIEYKYCLKRDEAEEIKWESIMNNGNRKLRVKWGTALSEGPIQYFDGIMLLKPEEGLVRRTVNYFRGTAAFSDQKTTASTIWDMLPSWEQKPEDGRTLRSVQTGRTVLECINILFESLRYWTVCSEMYDTAREACFKETLQKYVKARAASFNDRPESNEEPSSQMALAMTIVLLMQTYDIELGLKDQHRIISALQVQPDVKQRKCHGYDNLIKRHFPGQQELLAVELQNFIKRHVAKHRNDLQWFKCIPLIHFLEGVSKPFEPPELMYSREHTTPKWWGLGNIADTVQSFKKSFYSKESWTLTKMLTALASLYNVDFMLPRTILASLGHGSIPEITTLGILPQEALLGMIYYHMKMGNIGMANNVPMIKKLVDELSETLKAHPNGRVHSEAICDVAFHICVGISDVMRVKQPPIDFSCVIEVVKIAYSLYSRAGSKKNLNACENHLMEKLHVWLDKWLPTTMTKAMRTPGVLLKSQELDVWSELLGTDLGETSVKWRESLIARLHTRLSMLRPDDVLLIYQHHVKFDSHHKQLIDCISERAFDAAEKHLRGGGQFKVADSSHHRVWRLFSDVLTRMWPKVRGKPTHDPQEVLAHILTLHDFKRFLRFFRNEEASESMTDEYKECLMVAASILHGVVQGIVSGDILMSQLRYVIDNSKAFIENAEAAEAWPKDTLNREALRQIIDWREKELQCIQEFISKVSTLRYLCNSIKTKVDVSDLDKKLKLRDTDMKLSDACDCIKYDPKTGQFDKDRPQVTVFTLSADTERKLESFLKLEQSQVFLMVLNEAANACASPKAQDGNAEPLTLEQLFRQVWPMAENAWQDLTKSFIEGSVSLKYVKNLFRHYHAKTERVQEELAYMFTDRADPRINKRLQQIQRYFTLAKYGDGAKVIMEARDSLRLTGDFSMVEKIRDMTMDDFAPLQSITEEVEKTANELRGMTEDQIHCIKVYIESQPLVIWLKNHIKRLQELQTFVDLALISATGFGDYEVTKVSCVHAAVSGFAPLIYDLEETAGFREFYGKCRDVWRACGTDQNLPKKLQDLHAELEWLKGVSDAQGDVEVNALEQVSAINSRGIYIVGAGQNTSQTVEDVVRVIVPPEEKDRVPGREKVMNKTYTLADLKELQSKLMLVAGKAEKGKKDVDSFVEKFDGITGLASSFVNICSAGNILFKTWTAKFYCDPIRKNNAVIDFGLSEHMLSGSNKDSNVTQQIQQIREFIESCLEQWKNYIEEERKEFPELNHYTTEQLVILRGDLAQLVNGKDGNTDKVVALLKDVHPDCNMKHIQIACREAAKEQRPDDNHEKGSANQTDAFDKEDAERFKDLVDIYGHDCVAKAREMLGDVDIDKIESKCIDLEDMKLESQQMDVDDGTASDHEDIDIGDLQTKESMEEMKRKFLQQLLLDKQKSNLREKLDKLWENVHTTAAKSMADYLSIEHLGRILQHLSDKAPINRPLPTYLQQGQPNLIVCPVSDILSTVVSVYIEAENLPLPTRNEVLLCNEYTSSEEVELLVRRAVSDCTGRIFMLVSVQLLNYEVAAHLEKSIERYTQGHDKYNLVVICSSELQDRSQLVTALDNYRVRTPARPPLDCLRAYLLSQLKSNGGVEQTASQVDPENCCVRVVRSDRSGTGKSLWIKRKRERLLKKFPPEGAIRRCHTMSLPLYGKSANVNRVLEMLLPHTQSHNHHLPSLYHFNIPHEMQDGVDHLLFNLIILGSLVDPLGYAWRRSCKDFYVIEIMPLLCWEVGANDTYERGQQSVHHCLELLPTVMCRSPQESLQKLQHGEESGDQLMDLEEYCSVHFQRVFQFLSHLHANADLRKVTPGIIYGTPTECLTTLIRYCGLQDPSWAELIHFIRFLDIQLVSCTESSFCSVGATSDDALPGFLRFVVRFMIQMSRDFSTRSLNMTDETSASAVGGKAMVAEGMEEELVQFQLKRRWETSPHPYIFFNPDGATMTFMGFVIKKPNFDVVDPVTNVVIEEKIMSKPLFDGLRLNKVDLSENFDALLRMDKIKKLCMVMGNDAPHDPDDRYVLTSDNVKKILAIQMRFRCNIPVVIMGETGCGKTELIKFMCRLQCPKGKNIKNMLLMKVHGGTTEEALVDKIKEGERLAAFNEKNHPGIHTVLFLDEVNTTEALGLVKEVLCDHTLNGVPLRDHSSLRLIAACNPYRKHSQEVIEKLEQAGLGYHVKADQTTDKLGRIPMRHLVYRVQPLPQSLLPLVWDFGQLPHTIEKLYIRQIVGKKLATRVFQGVTPATADAITNVLVAAQNFMRDQQNECSFVSLRDVNRAMDVMAWFYHQRDTLFPMMDEQKAQQAIPARIGLLRQDQQNRNNQDIDENPFGEEDHRPSAVARSLILALGVCYHACLQERREGFRMHVCEQFKGDLKLMMGHNTITQEISLCQDVFLNGIELGPNIARNQALKENVFMTVVCIELRIPLFIVGKPGSSKSLAKTIVVDAMQGPNSRSDFFKKLKQVCMVSYQCSPLSTPDGIISTFRQCAQLQSKQDLDKFVAVVVLDEIGLAEDSPQMPLKTLHPLLEDGCATDEEQEEKYKKVGFIAISNWSLDPAKMNRGILVQRGPPDVMELEQTAKDICSSDEAISHHINRLMRPLAEAYTDLYNKALEIREFYGLRDFYSLVKMVNGFAKKNKRMPTWHQMKHAILRNFGGLDSVQPLQVFCRHLERIMKNVPHVEGDPDNTPAGLIKTSLDRKTIEGESRYLLVLTENYAALQILQEDLDAMGNAIIIFGSSFPKDQDYVVVCRNINRIKICMETGQTVILLNLESLYESLYDALNQYYTYFGGQRHVDLGLGSHRVKSRVHPKFRLIVVAEKEVVYEKFPIPLINRLEKHFIAKSTILTGQQQRIVKRLSNWCDCLATIQRNFATEKRSAQLKASDIFIGYHHDTCATIVLQVCHQLGNEGDEEWAQEVFHLSQKVLLQCATPEAIVRTRKSRLSADEEDLTDIYFRKQQHESLIDYLKVDLNGAGPESAYIQVTTHSRLLSNKDVDAVAHAVGLPPTALHSQVLHAFDTERQFSNLLREYFKMKSVTDQVLIIQCDSGDKSGDLIACIRYMIREEFNQAQQNQEEGKPQTKRHIVIIIQLPRVTGGCFIGFQGGMWKCVHLDDLRAQYNQMPPVIEMKNQPVSRLVRSAIETRRMYNNEREEVDMEVDPMPAETDTGNRVDDHFWIANRTQPYSHQLLRSCVHGAVAMLNDKANVANNTARIHILLSLLPKTKQARENAIHQVQFVNALEERVYLLLKDKEDTQMVGTMASDWLINEVASVDAINNAGTFRRSLWDCLEIKITPILAGLIAYVDTNNNLMLMTEDNWKQRMWLGVFSNPHLTPMTYMELVSAKRKNELKKIPVQMKGYDGTPMSGRLPFSWLLKSYVDTLIRQKERERVGDMHVSGSVGHLLKQSPWWPVLEAMFQEADIDTIKDCYLDDFVRMVYKPRTENALEEYSLVKRSLDTTLGHLERMEIGRGEKLGLEHLIPMVHVANPQIQGRIQLFADVLIQHPDIVNEVHQLLNIGETDPLSLPKEMALDVLAVRSVVKSIQPNHQLLRDREKSHAWLHQVEMTSPLVNTILARATNLRTRGLGSYSNVCLKALDEIWCDWNRVSTVKLFIEMVCPTGSDQEKLVTKYGPMLFKKLLGANFKTVETMKNVVRFLQFVTNEARDTYLSKVKECPSCKDKMVESVVMPCKHTVCEGCVKDLQDGGDFSCYVCKRKYEQHLKLNRLCESGTQVQKFQAFKQHCNAFLTELVSRMCFAGNTPPEDGVVTMLMGYITKQPVAKENQHPPRNADTKAMNLFNDNLDPTPIIRSVLLQLLLRSSLDKVRDHLDAYMRQACQLAKDEKDIIELAVLYIQCLEDHYHNTAGSGTGRERDLLAVEQLRLSLDELKSDYVTQLSGIAKARFGLSIVSEWMIKVLVRKQTPLDPTIINQLFEAGYNVCTQETHPGPSVFLMRQIARRYSLDELHQVAAVVPWVIPLYAQPDETAAAPDQFVVLGPGYTDIRNAMYKALMFDNMKPLTAALRGAGVDNRQQCVNILLAVYREITAKQVLQNPQKGPPPKAIEKIHEACKAVPALREQTGLLQALTRNTLATQCPQLEVSPHTMKQDLALHEVIVHFNVVITSSGVNKLLAPITNLTKDPATMTKSYLPTMPEDERFQLKNALNREGSHPTYYECPKGHVYMIGDCGRPVDKGKCPGCGAAIGGTAYNKLQAGNRPSKMEDTTRRGHSLGAPELRSPMAVLERTMTPACTTLVRLLLHLGLYVGANAKLQVVHSLITPTIQPADVPAFLWQHLRIDLEHISRVTGKGMDDTLLLIHLFIQHICLNAGGNIFQDPFLTTKEARRAWEAEFAKGLVTPFLHNLDERLRIANDVITHDDRQSNNSLRHYLYESEEHGAEVELTNHLDRAPAIWRYRTRVSIEHLTQELGENMAAHGGEDQQNLQQYQVLHLFLKKEPLLRVVRLLPDILHFITILTERYHRRIDRTEADELTIRHFLERDVGHHELTEEAEILFNKLTTAWTTVHTYLQHHGHVLPEEYCNQKITHDTPLSTFLPSDRGRGVCTVALLHYLTSVHNNFMNNYYRITKTPVRADVSFQDITPAHIISYDPERDLLPMVLANCTYSLEVGHGTRVEYNYRSLEQQLMERFIKGKAPLSFQLQNISYREELNNAALFKTLRMKIPQEPLSPTVRDKIRGDCQNMMEITDCLSSLDIAIGFLVSVGGEPGSSLSDFMIKTLQMDAAALMNMTGHHCKLCHSQVFWLLLSHEREKMASRQKHELFTSIDAHDYRVELSKKEKEDLRQALTHVDVDRFLSELHECIILHLTIKQDPNDEDYVDNKHHPLAEVLMVYIEDKDGMPIQALTNGVFLKDIRAEQCVAIWSEAFAYHETNIAAARRF